MSLLAGSAPIEGLARREARVLASVPDEQAVVQLEALSNNLFRATTIQDVKRLVGMAEALSLATRAMDASHRLQTDSMAMIVRCERRLGELTREFRPSRGTQSRAFGVPPRLTRKQVLHDNGISASRARQAEALAAPPAEVFERVLGAIDKPTTRSVCIGLGRGSSDPEVRTRHAKLLGLAEDAVAFIRTCSDRRRFPIQAEARSFANRLALLKAGDYK